MPLYVPRTTSPQEPASRREAPAVPVAAPPVNMPGMAVPPARQAAALAEELYQKDRAQYIETRVRELDVVRRQADEQVLGDYLQAQGSAAVDGRGQALEAIKANSKRISSGIKDRDVAMLWARQDAALTNAAIGRMEEHYRTQNLRWQADTIEARAETLSDGFASAALGDGYDPATGRLSDEAQRTRSAYRDEVARYGELTGAAPERVALLQRRLDSKAIGGVIAGLVQSDRGQEAGRVLAAHRGDLDAREADRLGELVARSTAQDQGTKLALEAMKPPPATSPEAGPLTFAQRFQADELSRLQRASQAEADLQRRFLSDGPDHISSEVLKVAVATLRSNEAQHQHELVTMREQVRAQGERWLMDNPAEETSKMPSDLAQMADAYGVADELNQFAANSRRYSTDPEFAAELRAKPDSWWRQQDPDLFVSANRSRLDNQALQWSVARIAIAQRKAKPTDLQKDQVRRAIDGALYDLKILDPKTGKPAGPEGAQQADTFTYEAYNLLENPPPSEDSSGWTIEKVLDRMRKENLADGSNAFTRRPSNRVFQVVDVTGRKVPLNSIVTVQEGRVVPVSENPEMMRKWDAAVQSGRYEDSTAGYAQFFSDAVEAANAKDASSVMATIRDEQDREVRAEQDQIAAAAAAGKLSAQDVEKRLDFLSRNRRAMGESQWMASRDGAQIPVETAVRYLQKVGFADITQREVEERAGIGWFMRMFGEPGTNTMTAVDLARMVRALQLDRQQAEAAKRSKEQK